MTVHDPVRRWPPRRIIHRRNREANQCAMATIRRALGQEAPEHEQPNDETTREQENRHDQTTA